MTDTEDQSLQRWAENLGPEAMNLWREAMSQLRQLHADVWNGVRFFLTVNGILVAAIFGLVRFGGHDRIAATLIALLALLGILITFVARFILSKHRDYYLQMLLRKTLIEHQLGFYQRSTGAVDLSFPWNVPQQELQQLLDDPSAWLKDRKSPKGTITRALFRVYEGVMAVYVLTLIVLSYAACKGYVT